MKLNSTQVSIFRILTHLLTLGFMIPAARFLGPINLGKVAVVVTLIPIFSDLIDFGGGTFVSRCVASRTFSSQEVRNYLSRKSIKCLFLLLPWVGILVLIGLESKLLFPLSACLVLANILNLFNSSMQQIAIAQKHAGSAAFGLFIERAGWSCFIVFVFAGIGVLGAFSLATLLGYFAQSAFHYFNTFRRLSKNSENQDFKSELGFKSYYDIGLKTTLSNLYLLNQIIVTTIAGATAGGIFSVAYRLRNLLVVGFTSVSWSITNDLLMNNTRESFKISLLKNRLTLTLNIFGIFILLLFSYEIVIYVFGLEYEKSITVLRLLCVSQLLSVFQILITTFLMCSYHEKSLRRMVSTIVPVTLLLEGTGALLDGARGAAIGTLLSSLASAFIYSRQFWKLSSI